MQGTEAPPCAQTDVSLESSLECERLQARGLAVGFRVVYHVLIRFSTASCARWGQMQACARGLV